MLLVGLTGGIGSGKTTVSGRLRALGAVVVDADEIVRELQEPGQIVLTEMVEHFGDRILLPDGRLDRQAVADLVFGDKEQLDALGKIVHPRVQEELLQRVGDLSQTDEVVVLDIPLLAESGWEGLVGTIVVDLEPDVAVERLVSQRGFAEEDARARIASQASREERLAKATWVVDNSGDPEALDPQLKELWGELQRRRDEALEA